MISSLLLKLTVPRRYFFCGSFMFLFCLVFAMFCVRLFICALWSTAGKGLTSWLSFVVSTVSLSLSHWYPGSGVVLDCIDSWSLHLYLLCLYLDIGWAFIFIAWYPNFRLYILYSVKFGIKIFTGCGLWQDTISTYKLSIYVKNMLTKFHEIQGPVTYFFNLM